MISQSKLAGKFNPIEEEWPNFITEDDLIDESNSFNPIHDMNVEFTEVADKAHVAKANSFILNQLFSQSHIKFELGTSEQMKVPLHDDIENHIFQIRRDLCRRFRSDKIDKMIIEARLGPYSVSPLNDLRQIQVDMIILIRKRDGFENDSFFLTDNQVTYEFKLPTILQLEFTTSNHTNRLFDKILRGVVNATHLRARPSLFFWDLERRKKVEKIQPLSCHCDRRRMVPRIKEPRDDRQRCF